MNNPIIPLVDDDNPLYCPAISADAYLQSLRRKIPIENIKRPEYQHQDLSHFFTHVLGRSSYEDTESASDDRENTFGSHWILGASGPGLGQAFGRSPLSEDLPPYSPINLARKKSLGRRSPYAVMKPRLTPGIKRRSHFSDFEAPPKYARSTHSVHESSFEIEQRHEKLQYGCKGSSPQEIKAQDFQDIVLRANDDISALIGRLNCVYSGIRLKERLENLNATTAQELADFLGQNGYINGRVLKIFRYTCIERVIFAPSIFDENGLNLVEDGIFSVFSSADSFRYLTELSYAGIRIQDSHLLHIHHLPNLSILHINETGIGNEGVFLLVPLKRTLTRLFLAANPDIGNDAVPAILLLSRLSFLSILDTGIDMIGLRRLAQHMHEHNHIMDIEIPYACEVYVDGIVTQYALNPLPPLITNPQICGQLSSAALRRNLEAHAAYNPSIVVSGTRPEMLNRLSELLKVRKLDILVMGMLDGTDNIPRNG